jgi:DNA-directed RNA polymerase subunit M/transcription elongation factor TFIIS
MGAPDIKFLLILLIMETKLIEGTNEQYSIREDGVVFIHYRRKRISNTRKDEIKCNDTLSVLSGNLVDIVINNKVYRKSINTLLFETFNFKYCNKCNNKFIPNVSPIKCDKCRRTNRLAAAIKYSKEWCKNNPEKVKALTKKRSYEIHKSYVAGILNLKCNELPDDLYNLYKIQILIKRKLSKKTGISIHTFK